MSQRPRVALVGSGAFALPSFQALQVVAEVALVVTQPPRNSGRGLHEEPTPVGAWARGNGLPLLETADLNSAAALVQLRSARPACLLVIAFGQKLSPEVLEGYGAFNLHGSMLPAWRGAAPIQRAIMAGDTRLGVSVISLAARMDAGEVYARADLSVGDDEVSSEAHDRLALLGAPLMVKTLHQWQGGTLAGEAQVESRSTHAAKLRREDAWVDFNASAALVRARINGLSPWPGVDAVVAGESFRILRAASGPGVAPDGTAHGTLLDEQHVACASGVVCLREVQPRGGRRMSLRDFIHGRRLSPGVRIESAPRR